LVERLQAILDQMDEARTRLRTSGIIDQEHVYRSIEELACILLAMLESEQEPRHCSKCNRSLGSVDKPVCGFCEKANGTKK